MGKRKRYEDGWVIEFPKGSDWKDKREGIKDIAFLRRVSIGAIMLEAMTEYLQKHPRPRLANGQKS